MVQSADRTSQPIFSKWNSPWDWPWPLHTVVNEARRIISYWENVPEEALPPESIWHSSIKCKSWIDEHLPYKKDGKSSGGMLTFSDREIEPADG